MSTGGFLVRFFGGMAIGLAVVAFVLGSVASARRSHASGVLGAGQERGAWAGARELVWLHKLGVWEASLMQSLNGAASRSSDARAAARDLQAVRRCSSSLHAQVGDPPTMRLRPALELVEGACARLEHAASAQSASTADAEGRDAGKLLLRADELVPPGETRSLPVIAGDSVASRIDPVFSRIASAIAGKDVEVRCWSRLDWTKLLREEKAYTLHHIENDTLGFAGIYGTRDNLSPEVCDSLGELRYHHWQPRSPGAELLLATAVVTLSHEPEHSKGVAVEARAECNAIQLMASTAVKLGATPTYAAELQSLYWAHYDTELPEYRSPKCRNGGPYDLNPNRASFP